MPRQLATVVLACAALGSLAFAGERIAGAKQQPLSEYQKHVRIYGTTPALAAATLRSLRRPPGFREVPCKPPETGWACWIRSPSFPLGAASMGRLFAAMGVAPFSLSNDASDCGRLRQDRRYHLAFQTCEGETLKGRERLMVFATSTATPADKPTTRGLAGFPFPTQVNIFVIGHFEHEGVRPGEEDG
jgi:hypothetical protein